MSVQPWWSTGPTTSRALPVASCSLSPSWRRWCAAGEMKREKSYKCTSSIGGIKRADGREKPTVCFMRRKIMELNKRKIETFFPETKNQHPFLSCRYGASFVSVFLLVLISYDLFKHCPSSSQTLLQSPHECKMGRNVSLDWVLWPALWTLLKSTPAHWRVVWATVTIIPSACRGLSCRAQKYDHEYNEFATNVKCVYSASNEIDHRNPFWRKCVENFHFSLTPIVQSCVCVYLWLINPC